MIVRYFVSGHPQVVAERHSSWVPVVGTQVFFSDPPAVGDYVVSHIVDRPHEGPDGGVEVWVKPL